MIWATVDYDENSHTHSFSNTSTCENFSPFRLVPSSVMVMTFPSGETLRMAIPLELR
jgi:hypothetical protein